MKTSTVTIRLDRQTERALAAVCKRAGTSRSEFVRQALRRQLALARFDALRNQVLPAAERAGYLTDEDVSRDVS
jgi:predicted transcriptional regulator